MSTDGFGISSLEPISLLLELYLVWSVAVYRKWSSRLVLVLLFAQFVFTSFVAVVILGCIFSSFVISLS